MENIVWMADNFVSGTGFLCYAPDSLNERKGRLAEAARRAVGANPSGPDAYYDYEAGYDGWELSGRFKGQTFTLYTRWNNLRIGGFMNEALDVAGLIAALEQL